MSPSILAALIGAGTTIAVALLTFLVQAKKHRKETARTRKVVVKHITDPTDSDVAIALRLFERRIPSEERDAPDDIVRWLWEIQRETKDGICELSDFFLVANVEDNLAGFAYLQFYPRFSLGYFSYLVIENDPNIPEARECHVCAALLQRADRLMFRSKLNCKGVVLEVDEPSILRGRNKMEATARIRRFKSLSRQLRFPLKTLSIPYLQPRLSIDETAEEYPMRLMYAIPNPSTEPSRITKKETVEILRFLSDAIYGDHFAHRADWDQKYRTYLTSWREKLAHSIPDVVELL